MNIDTLQPRELDAAIAEQIFGWVGALKCNPEMGLMDDWKTMDEIPHYSTDPAAMMKVAEEMTRRKCSFDIAGGWDEPDDPDSRWRVDITDHGNAVPGVMGSAKRTTAYGPTLTLAFARAALKTVERGRGSK